MVRLALYGFAVLASVMMVVAPAAADTINFTVAPENLAGPSWQGPITVNGTQVTNTAYWNNGSTDCSSGTCLGNNIGDYMVSGDGAGKAQDLNFNPLNVQFWATSTGASDNNIVLNTGSTGVSTSLRVEVAGLAASNEFGYFLLSDPNTLIPLFLGSDGLGKVATFLPTGDFGLYLKNTISNNLFRTDTATTAGFDNDGFQHFAPFRNKVDIGARTVWMGIEDLIFGGAGCSPNGTDGCSDRDFQDMIVRIDAVPEPATLLLLGTGLVGMSFAGVRARRRK